MFEMTTIDWILLGGTGVLMVIGLFRGISGELGSLLGLAAGVLAGFLLYGVAQGAAESFGFGSPGSGVAKGAAIGIDVVMALAVGGLVRLLVRKFVSFLMGRVVDSALGILSGLIKGVLIIGTLTGFGLVKAGPELEGPLVAHSPIVAEIASWAEAYSQGTAK